MIKGKLLAFSAEQEEKAKIRILIFTKTRIYCPQKQMNTSTSKKMYVSGAEM